MKPEPLAAALEDVNRRMPHSRTILLSPQGRVFNQGVALELAGCDGLVLVCGRYEGVDERICLDAVDEEISIGDYVLSGGELPAMVVIEAVVRLIPGVLGGDGSAEQESFADGLLDHPHFTRPPMFQGEAVPDVLLSGNHRRIQEWRLENALVRTLLKRPDLLQGRDFSAGEMRILERWYALLGKILKAAGSAR